MRPSLAALMVCGAVVLLAQGFARSQAAGGDVSLRHRQFGPALRAVTSRANYDPSKLYPLVIGLHSSTTNHRLKPALHLRARQSAG